MHRLDDGKRVAAPGVLENLIVGQNEDMVETGSRSPKSSDDDLKEKS